MLIPQEEVCRILRLDRLRMTWLAPAIMRSLCIHKLNASYENIKTYQKEDFIAAFLNELQIQVIPNPGWENHIPQQEPFILISNHPHGALDGIILFHLIRSLRKDFVFLGNFMLSRIPQLENMLIPVNPLNHRKGQYSSLSGLRHGFRHLESSGTLGIFPAAGISSFQMRKRRVEDPDWNISGIKFILKTNVRVVPVFIHGHNSWIFQLLSMIHPDLKLVRQIAETYRKAESRLQITIGKSFWPAQLGPEVNSIAKAMKNKVYKLNKY